MPRTSRATSRAPGVSVLNTDQGCQFTSAPFTAGHGLGGLTHRRDFVRAFGAVRPKVGPIDKSSVRKRTMLFAVNFVICRGPAIAGRRVEKLMGCTYPTR